MDEPRRLTKSEISDKLKVVLFCSEWGSSKGGLSTFNRHLSCHLAKRSDLEVLCFLPKVLGVEEEDAEKNKVTLVEAEPIPGELLKSLEWWPMQQPPPDVIISHGLKFGRAAFSIKKSYSSCKWVHFVHVNYEEIGKYKDGELEIGTNNQKYSEELHWCENADVVVAVGPQLLDSYRRSLSIKQKKVEIFYPGLSNEFLKLPVQNFKSEQFHILLCCRCSFEDFEVKGIDIISDAIGKLGKKYTMKLLGVVTNEEGMMLRKIVKETKATKNQLCVQEYCKNREELKRKICAVDLVVMPSRAEAFGLIGLEALSAGVPLLVSADSGLGMTLKELNCGEICVVESDDPREWAKRIELLKEKKRSQRTGEINYIRDQYGDKYKWDEQCSTLVTLFLDD